MTMRRLAITLLLGGCGSPAAPVAVHFSNSNASPTVGAGYNAGVGTATLMTDGSLKLDSVAGGAELLVTLDAPDAPGKVTIGERHLDVEYTLGPAGWASNSGSVTFNRLDPYDVTFDNLEMIKATDSATGAFFLSGEGTFKK